MTKFHFLVVFTSSHIGQYVDDDHLPYLSGGILIDGLTLGGPLTYAVQLRQPFLTWHQSNYTKQWLVSSFAALRHLAYVTRFRSSVRPTGLQFWAVVRPLKYRVGSVRCNLAYCFKNGIIANKGLALLCQETPGRPV